MKFSRPITEHTPRKERYTLYFESLRREMELKHDWKNIYTPGENRCRFLHRADAERFELRVPTFSYSARFSRGDKVETYVSMRHNQELFDHLRGLKSEIEADFGSTLDWLIRPGVKKRAVISLHPGNIFATQEELEEYGEWHIEKLLKLNEVFTPKIKRWFANQ